MSECLSSKCQGISTQLGASGDFQDTGLGCWVLRALHYRCPCPGCPSRSGLPVWWHKLWSSVKPPQLL